MERRCVRLALRHSTSSACASCSSTLGGWWIARSSLKPWRGSARSVADSRAASASAAATAACSHVHAHAAAQTCTLLTLLEAWAACSHASSRVGKRQPGSAYLRLAPARGQQHRQRGKRPGAARQRRADERVERQAAQHARQHVHGLVLLRLLPLCQRGRRRRRRHTLKRGRRRGARRGRKEIGRRWWRCCAGGRLRLPWRRHCAAVGSCGCGREGGGGLPGVVAVVLLLAPPPRLGVRPLLRGDGLVV